MATPRRTIVSITAAVAAAAVLAVPAAVAQQSLVERKQQVDSRLASLRGQIEAAKEKEGVLSTQIESAGAGIESLEGDIAALTDRLAAIEADLAEHRARLARLEDRYREQTAHLERLKRDHARAQRQLEQRLIALYQTDDATAVDVLLQVESLRELIEQIDYLNQIGRQDRHIAEELERLKGEMRRAREETAKLKDEVGKATAALAAKAEEQRAARAALVAEQEALAAARTAKRSLLVSVREDRHEAEEDLAAMEAAGAQLAAQIQAAQQSSSSGSDSSAGSSGGSGGGSTGDSSGGDSTPSARGLVWPVAGTVTSGFGQRWGRLHAGIDIAAPYGATVRAAASGQVIYAGVMGGYGNIVVIDHGGALATAYAHLSSIWVGGGSVSQGQGIGAVGCTGSCTGNHLHFEVRVNGIPVDPLAYL